LNETTENFWKAFNEWDPPPPKPIFHRLYHDDAGLPLFYSMEDVPGNYIEIDRETFSSLPSNVRVVDNKLTYIKHTITNKLVPGDTGTPCDPRDICVVVDNSIPNIKWSLRTNETS